MSFTLLSWTLLAFLLLAGGVEIVLRALQLAMALIHDAGPCSLGRGEGAVAFVSVHVPTCNEPPALVIATLESLARSRFDHFEVIVVDNNTRDAALWRPVRAAAARLGFRFMHVERLAGAKAGALNLALAAMDARATHVAIVDADYQVDDDFLGQGIAAMASGRVDYVQFPQAYRGVGRAARGVEFELGDYFACFANGAGQPGSMLPTGTLSLFRAAALRAIGGWPTATITEDAEIGVRLQAAGYRGLWLARTVGRGLLPVDLRGIRKQRARWSAGNVQVLARLPAALRQAASARDLLYLVAQLTAWVTLLLPAALVLVVVPFVPGLPLAHAITTVAAATVLLSMSLTAGRIVLVGDRSAGLAVRGEALATRTALLWTSATAWAAALWPRPLRFHCTAKAVGTGRASHDLGVFAISVAFLALAGVQAVAANIVASLACLALATVWLCGRFVDRALRHAAAGNPEMS